MKICKQQDTLQNDLLKNIIMKRILFFSTLILTCLTFIGCPYESKVPIDKPTVKINPKYLGTWEHEGNSEKYKITKYNNFTYQIEKIKQDDTLSEKLFAYTSLVNGTNFLNLWDEPTDTPKKYTLYKLQSTSDHTILLSEVTENIDEQFSSSDQLKKFISENMNRSYFYTKTDMVLKRIKN